MAGPITPYKPRQLVNTAVAGQSTGTTGVKASYVVPAARIAKVTWASSLILTGAAEVVSFQVIVGGVTVNVTIPAAGASSTFAGGIWLNTGDTAQWNVTTLGVGTTDLLICVEEFDAA